MSGIDDGDLDPGWAADEAFRDGYEAGAAVAFGLMGMGEAIRAQYWRPFQWVGGRAYPPLRNRRCPRCSWLV